MIGIDEKPNGASMSPYMNYIFWNTKFSNVRQEIREKKGGKIRLTKEQANLSGLFREGYNLEGLKEIKDYQKFFQEKGIHYINGILTRFNKKTSNFLEEGQLEIILVKTGLHPKSKAYREAKKFKENYYNLIKD